MIVGEEREREREKNIFYYFIRQFILFYQVVCKNKNQDVWCIVGWVSKIDKIVSGDVKYVFYFYFYFFISPIVSD